MGSLYIVSTPIGNRKDITLRALEVLSKASIILCEDTRKTGMLLKHYQETQGIKFTARLVSFFEENEESRIPQIVDWLNKGEEIALVSSAGTPLLSDPGFKLVRECVKQEIQVLAVPGASALLAGLVVSGLPINNFMYLGFLPKKSGKKEKLLTKAMEIQKLIPQTVVFYESPFRILKTLKLLEQINSEAQVVLGRELTKKFEEVQRGTPVQLIKELKDKKIKGELVVMVKCLDGKQRG